MSKKKMLIRNCTEITKSYVKLLNRQNRIKIEYTSISTIR